MNPVSKAAAVAGGLVSAAAITMAVLLPLHHSVPASAVTGTGTSTTVSSGTGSGTGQSAPGGGSSGSGGSQSGTGTGTGGSGTGSGGGSTGGTGKGSSGSGATGSSGGKSGPGVIHPIISGLPHLTIPLVTAIPSPTGTIGDPNVPCLQGYVWRKAYSGDYVCVTPANRTQAAADNAAALSRVQSGGGAYGTYTCVQGYVWRQVVPDDYTCVTPAVRSQAWYDNSQAGNRVALLNLWVTDWTPPSQPSNPCNGDVCTTTSGGWDGPNFQVNGDAFNFGPVLVQIRSNAGQVLWSQTVTAGSYTGYSGASFGVQTQIGDCSSVPGTSNDDYVIAYDTVSGRWSSSLPIDSDCASF
jgi:hypothetical protein